MEYKKATLIFMLIGSAVGGFIPSLWGAGSFSFSAILLSTIGAIAGVYFAYKINH